MLGAERRAYCQAKHEALGTRPFDSEALKRPAVRRHGGMPMHVADNDPRRLLLLKLTAEGMTIAAQRDLVEYWGRRKAEGRPNDWT